jgi:hypothetical protein
LKVGAKQDLTERDRHMGQIDMGQIDMGQIDMEQGDG